MTKLSSPIDAVTALVAQRKGCAQRIERVFYEIEGEVQEGNGEVQVHFDDGVLRLRGAANGELLEVSTTAWVDPFEGQLTPDNGDFVRVHGRWRLVDVSDRPNYKDVVGRRLTNVAPLTNRFGSLIGFQLELGEAAMNVFVHADEVHVSWGHENIPMWGKEWVDT